MVKVLITGATGFIGQACINLLQETEFEIHALYNVRPNNATKQNITWHKGNLLDTTFISSFVKKIRPEYLLHLAWFVEHDTFWSSEKNLDYILASIQLYKEFSLQGGQHAVFLGTCAEYDNSYSVCDEDTTPLLPNTLYGLAKKQTFELLKKLKELNPSYASFAWVRSFNIFGPYENINRLVPFIFNSYFKKSSPTLKNPSAVRDYLFTEDLAEMLLALLVANPKEYIAVNAGQGKAISLAELANFIHSQFFSHFPPPNYSILSQEKEDCFIPDLKKLHNLNIRSAFKLEDRLESAFKWWTSQIHHSTHDRV